MTTTNTSADSATTEPLGGFSTQPDDDDLGPVDGEEPFDDDDDEDDEDEMEADEDEIDEQPDREMTGEIGSEGGGPDVTRVPGPEGRYPRG